MSGYISLATYQQAHELNMTPTEHAAEAKAIRSYQNRIKLLKYYNEASREVIRACHGIAGEEIFTRYLQMYLQTYSIQTALMKTIKKCVEYKRSQQCLKISAKPNGVQ